VRDARLKKRESEITRSGIVSSLHYAVCHHIYVPLKNKKHLKNVGPIRHCEPPHAYSPGVATVATVARRLRIDVHDNADANDDNDNNDNDNA